MLLALKVKHVAHPTMNLEQKSCRKQYAAKLDACWIYEKIDIKSLGWMNLLGVCPANYNPTVFEVGKVGGVNSGIVMYEDNGVSSCPLPPKKSLGSV